MVAAVRFVVPIAGINFFREMNKNGSLLRGSFCVSS